MQNPYASPKTYEKPINGNSPEESTRQEHLSHEASIKSFGVLYFLGAVVLILVGIGSLSASVVDQFATPFFAVVGIFYIIIGGLQFWIGSGLRSLNMVGRIGGTVFGALGLLGFPIGTLISGYLLYLLWSEKGNVVFSEDYKRIIEATPHIKYKTSIIVWILLGLLVLLAVIGIMASLVG